MVEREQIFAHPGRDELECYVSGMLADADVARLDDHVRRCAECAEALAHEARLEVAMGEIAAAVSPSESTGEVSVSAPRVVELRSRRERVARAAGVGFAGLAAAAVAVFALSALGARGGAESGGDGTTLGDDSRGALPGVSTEFCPDAADGHPCGAVAEYTGGDASARVQ